MCFFLRRSSYENIPNCHANEENDDKSLDFKANHFSDRLKVTWKHPNK
jgi:hypothetical protein